MTFINNYERGVYDGIYKRSISCNRAMGSIL